MLCPGCAAPLADATARCPCGEEADPLLGQVLDGRYAIRRRLAEGGYGAVYEADHLALECKAAIKVLGASSRFSPEARERFRREALAAGRLSHPCSVRIYDRGESSGGQLWIAMELLAGETLAGRLARAG